ncbi:hypothetical protein HUS23_08785 [Ectothiorhodospiraceae bacterium 2226]|nr:hypothetical protein HUS23_08785 [Ectothiorhodospiraceae bacterium 2226]
MTIATLRPTAGRQATTVGHVNEGLTPYFFCGQSEGSEPRPQRPGNADHPHDTPDMAITDLSMPARAHAVE